MLKKLLIAADVDPHLAEVARSDGRFEVDVRPVRTEDELASIVADAHVLVTRAYNKVSGRVIESARQLEVIAQGTSGTDNIDDAAARARGIPILSLPGENANAVAELVIGCILSLTRTIPFYTREVAAGRWPRQDCATRHEMRYFHLGIVGLGQVGMRVARLARTFGMDVTAYDPYLTDAQFAERQAGRVESFDRLLASSDIVTMHVPLTSETRRMIGRDPLQRMRRGTILINAARGEVIDQRAALDALASNQLSGLVLDVFDPEPPEGPLPDDPRLILTPHIGGCTHECRSAIGDKLWKKILRFYAEPERSEGEASTVTPRRSKP
ncbi:MAG TPA: NAD(P)-dependent oxidoreductase [Thermoanaerobaculia bacterium]|nr:NAD(P)-dependent oxidoreductase [Thermoanaerobaculia bacterium]